MQIIDQAYLTSIGGPTIGDAGLAALSAAVEDYLGRGDLAADDRVEWVDGTGERWVRLDSWPITRVYWLACRTVRSLAIQFSGSGRASVEIDRTSLTLRSGTTDTTILFSGFATLDALKTEIETNAGWTCTVSTGHGERPSTYLRPEFISLGVDSTTRTEALVLTADGAVDARPDQQADRDLITSTAVSEGLGNVFVHYRAGYESGSVPAGLQQAVARMASDWFHELKHASNLTAEKIADYSYEPAVRAGQDMKPIVERYAADLNPYRNMGL